VLEVELLISGWEVDASSVLNGITNVEAVDVNGPFIPADELEVVIAIIIICKGVLEISVCIVEIVVILVPSVVFFDIAIVPTDVRVLEEGFCVVTLSVYIPRNITNNIRIQWMGQSCASK